MILRTQLRTIHAIAGTLALGLIFSFLASSIVVELFGGTTAIAAVKSWIVSGLFLLVPALALAGASGGALAGAKPKGLGAKKLRRMKIIAANGVLVLVPAAIFLDGRAAVGTFDLPFYIVQQVELVAGAANLVLLGLNMRDGLRMTARIGRAWPRQTR